MRLGEARKVSARAWHIRPATPADAPELARLRYAFRTERRPATEPEAEFLERCAGWMVRSLADRDRWRCWVAVSESQLVGTVWLQLIEKLPNPGEESEINGYVTSVYVIPALRHEGVGSGLVSTCLKQCDGMDVDAVFLWSTPHSRRLYERHGFAVRDDLLERR
jgi:GNAT superfamily N-acetyltransferase